MVRGGTPKAWSVVVLSAALALALALGGGGQWAAAQEAGTSGKARAWGWNLLDQTDVPVAAQGGVKAVAGGRFHSLALREDGSVVAWGSDGQNQTIVPAGAQGGVKAIAGGINHSLALKEDGSVVAWGDNDFGQTDVPTEEAQGGVKAIAGGGLHSLALREDGSVVAWGYNNAGQTDVPAGAQGGVKAVAAGVEHSLALKEDGSVVAWGRNQYGQTTVPTGLKEAVAIAGGGDHSLALEAPTPPGPVDFFEADAGEGRASLSWANPTDPDFRAVRVLRSTIGPATGPMPNAEQIQVYEGMGESFEDGGLQNGTTYYYTAYAKDDAGLWSARATRRATPADATGPSVGATSPTPGATRVPIRANATATFSEAMRSSSLTGSTFKLVKAGTRRVVPATVGYDPETREATLNPSAKLAKGTRYTATVTTGAEDLAGNGLDQSKALAGEQPKRWSFVTAR